MLLLLGIVLLVTVSLLPNGLVISWPFPGFPGLPGSGGFTLAAPTWELGIAESRAGIMVMTRRVHSSNFLALDDCT